MRRLHPSLSAEKMLAAWKGSRDSTPSRAGAPGVDGITASDFKAKLQDNITSIQADIRARRYPFSRLRMAPVSKPSGGHRIIAVPTVRDRLLQRTVLRHLETDRRFLVDSNVSYGFTKGRTLPDAQRAALKLREKHPWMLQVDIVKFFDRIPRDRVKTLVNRRVGSKLIAEIICQAIDCELERSSGQNHRLPELSGILIGVGLRQGMPLSPMLSNLLLQKFDQDVGRQGISALRYADDIAVFCDSKADCLRALELMQEALKRVDLQIPDLEDNGKTQLIEASATAAFLGVEIKRIEDGYKLCPPFRRIADIQADMEQVARLESCVANGRNVGKVLRLLDSLIIGHGASMIVLDDPGASLKRLDAAKAKSMNGLLVDLLGKNVVDKLDDSHLAVLGLKPFPSPTRRYRPRRKAHPN